ncbi:hypothetical protein BKA62DRAFT_825122 [Auriculariales sp. MPI-PUGE-AT-0066]|nr:hypothetical protein BKA62DRAFT_825122 [Auriculariales sp. MPI-PUGE-AT-0066]
MHAAINDEKRLVCKEFVEALEACHLSLFNKYTFQCEGAKQELNMCLRQLRLDKSERNRADAKLRTEKFKKALEALDADD